MISSIENIGEQKERERERKTIEKKLEILHSPSLFFFLFYHFSSCNKERKFDYFIQILFLPPFISSKLISTIFLKRNLQLILSILKKIKQQIKKLRKNVKDGNSSHHMIATLIFFNWRFALRAFLCVCNNPSHVFAFCSIFLCPSDNIVTICRLVCFFIASKAKSHATSTYNISCNA